MTQKLTGTDHEVFITDTAFGGDGVGRIDGQVVFVPFVIKGEKVLIRILSQKKGILRGKLLKVMEPSPNRVKASCELFGRCGGCQYQHISYPAQLALKTKQVTDCLERIGKITAPPVREMIASPKQFAYRNKITLHTREGQTGFLDTTGARIVPVKHCPLADDEINSRLDSFLKKSRPADGDHVFRNLPPESGELAARAFHQTNTSILPSLLSLTGNLLPAKCDVLIDAYCGAGFFTFEFASRFATVMGIELSPEAIAAANQRETAASHIEFIAASVEAVLPEILSRHAGRETVLILDPPRTGCEAPVLETIRSIPPEQIVYISCNPSTLARDLLRLEGVYTVESVTPLDMFPQTAHVECVASLKKRL